MFYHILMVDDRSKQQQMARSYLRHVLAGYQSVAELNPRWRELFPLVLKRREIVLYIVVHRAMDLDNLDDWGTRYMRGRRESIIERCPFLDFDFDRFKL